MRFDRIYHLLISDVAEYVGATESTISDKVHNGELCTFNVGERDAQELGLRAKKRPTYIAISRNQLEELRRKYYGRYKKGKK